MAMTSNDKIPKDEFNKHDPHFIVYKNDDVRFVQKGVAYDQRGGIAENVSVGLVSGTREDGGKFCLDGKYYTGGGNPVDGKGNTTVKSAPKPVKKANPVLDDDDEDDERGQ